MKQYAAGIVNKSYHTIFFLFTKIHSVKQLKRFKTVTRIKLKYVYK